MNKYLFSIIALFSCCVYSAQAENPLAVVRRSFEENSKAQLALYNFDFELNPDAKKLVEQMVDNLMTKLRIRLDTELTEEQRAKLVAKLSDVPLKFASLETKLKAILKQKFALRRFPLPMQKAIFDKFQNTEMREDAKKEWLSEDIAWQVFKEECLKDLGLYDFILFDVVIRIAEDFRQILLEVCDFRINGWAFINKQIKFILYGLIFGLYREFEKNYLHGIPLLPIATLAYGAKNLHKEAYGRCDNSLDIRCDFNKIVYSCIILASIFSIELLTGYDCPILWTSCFLLIFTIVYKKYLICEYDFKTKEFLKETVDFVGETFKLTLSLIFILTKMFLNKHEIYQECLDLGNEYIDQIVPLVIPVDAAQEED